MSKRLVSQLALVASLILIYFASGKLGLRLAFVNASATAVRFLSTSAPSHVLLRSGRHSAP